MKMQKRLKMVLVLLVCFAMLLPFSPTTSAANELSVIGSAAENEDVILDASDSITEKTDSIVADDTATLQNGVEVVSLREENVKHFDMGNGTYQAIAYSHPVHEQDSEGNWQNIDFSMNLTQTRGVSTYTNTSGTAFAASYIANQPLMSMGEGNAAITMTLLPNINTETMSTRASAGTAAVQAQCTATQTQIQTYADAQAASFSNTLLYENVMPGIDLEYIVDPWTVKENIIVNQRAGQYSYRFKLDMPGMYPALQPDGSVFIYNNETDAKEYLIPAPYMYDAYGEMSFDVSYAISGNNGIYYLTVTADSSWINAEERIFPVTIDPTVYLGSQTVNMDTYINEDTADEPRGLYKFFFVGENEVAYIYMPTPTLPSCGVIDSAALQLYYFYKDHITTGYVDFAAYRVTDLYWAQESLIWNNVVNNGYENQYGLATTPETDPPETRVYANRGATSASPKLVEVGVTNAVRAWMDDDTANRGIGLKYIASPNRSVMFRSTEGHVNYRPKLLYNYIIVPRYEVNLILQYDGGYIERYPNAESRIIKEAKVLEDFFRNEFDIIVYYDDPVQFESLYDQCEGTNTTCSCAECKNTLTDPYHHSSMHANMEYLTCPDENSIKMAYLGRIACYPAIGGGCFDTFPYGGGGLSEMNWRTMVINNLRPDESELVTMIHEMGHMFGAVDHYSKREYNTKRDECLYGIDGYNGNDPGEITLCDECRGTIEQNRGIYSG